MVKRWCEECDTFQGPHCTHVPEPPERPEARETRNDKCPMCGHSGEPGDWVKMLEGPVWVVAVGLLIFLLNQ